MTPRGWRGALPFCAGNAPFLAPCSRGPSTPSRYALSPATPPAHPVGCTSRKEAGATLAFPPRPEARVGQYTIYLIRRMHLFPWRFPGWPGDDAQPCKAAALRPSKGSRVFPVFPGKNFPRIKPLLFAKTAKRYPNLRRQQVGMTNEFSQLKRHSNHHQSFPELVLPVLSLQAANRPPAASRFHRVGAL